MNGNRHFMPTGYHFLSLLLRMYKNHLLDLLKRFRKFRCCCFRESQMRNFMNFMNLRWSAKSGTDSFIHSIAGDRPI